MKSDFTEAKGEILIVSPFVRKKRVDVILEWLLSASNFCESSSPLSRNPTSIKNSSLSTTALFGTDASTC
jgi:hypothetical protein